MLLFGETTMSKQSCPAHSHRALGDLDFKRAARGITNEPAVLRHTLRPGADLALVTVSDGVTDVLSDDDIGRLVVRAVRKVGSWGGLYVVGGGGRGGGKQWAVGGAVQGGWGGAYTGRLVVRAVRKVGGAVCKGDSGGL
jgi:hypothetical protein